MKILDKEILEELFLKQNITKENICRQLHISIKTLDYNLQLNNLTRNKNANTSSTLKKTLNEKYQSIIDHIDLDELRRLYLVENKSYNFLLSYYQITGWTLDKILRANDIKKPKSQSASMVLDTKYAHAGSKKAYDKQVREKQLNTCISKYGSTEKYFNHISEQCSKTWNSKSDGDIAARRNKINATCMQKYGVPYYCMSSDCRAASSNDSGPNLYFASLLTDNNINYEREFILDNYSYDFKVGNILIEINPTPTHNSTWSPFENPKAKDYHYNKSKTAEQFGFRCIHVWDWDNLDKIIKLLCLRKTVYARTCDIKEVPQVLAQKYLNEYHLQRYAKDSIRIGLYVDDNLVSIMTFGKPRYNKNYEYELVRYCSHYNVIGGAEKLFTYFIRNYNPTSIISYCDRAKFIGSVYKKLGFEYISTAISKHWYNMKTGVHITDNLLRARGFDQLLGNQYGYYGKGSPNEELMLKSNFVEIFDCGQATFIWKNKNTV